MSLRSASEIAAIGRAGRIVSAALEAAVDLAQPGVTTGRLDEVVSDVYRSAGAEAIFRGAASAAGATPFPAASCVSVNQQALHGIPGDRVLQDGDLLTIDTGCRFEGWCADSATSVGVGRLEADAEVLLSGGRRALEVALEVLGVGGRWLDVVRRVHEEVDRLQLRLIEGPAGHGIGRDLHEDPLAGWRRRGESDFDVVDGLVLAVEPVVTTGDGRLRLAAGGWTLETIDGHPTVHFEQTVAVTSDGLEILTPCRIGS
ncbi:MAG: type I methionyl aminopeptidase [Planctomycetaceae bacterium]